VASASSAARAIQVVLAETSLRVAGVQSIANWNFPEMRDLLAPSTVRAVTSYSQVHPSARQAGMLSDAESASSCAATPTRAGTAGIPASQPTQSRPFSRNTCFNSRAAIYLQHLLQAAGQKLFSGKPLTAFYCHFRLLAPRK
jgi:hypothetical protein